MEGVWECLGDGVRMQMGEGGRGWGMLFMDGTGGGGGWI